MGAPVALGVALAAALGLSDLGVLGLAATAAFGILGLAAAFGVLALASTAAPSKQIDWYAVHHAQCTGAPVMQSNF